ncbi:MAG: SusC/RagA family TonB-linked outer membrane protein [Cytophagaceae bacterium SCN 52-12]|nr:MAG: SusC/RagA family TonB-linked outer membrane protein [Cytophagaceae bacterium SCN 52-12]
MEKKNKRQRLPFYLMKLTFYQLVITVVFAGIVSAGASRAQDILSQHISVEILDKKMKDALRIIEKQSDVKFVYSSRLVDVNRKVNLVVHNMPLAQVLEKLLFPQQLKYEISGRQLILDRQEKKAGISSPESMIIHEPDRGIRGKVTDSSNEALPGVNVLVKGTQTGTATNADGVFSLNIPDEGATLIFSFVGYRSQEVATGGLSVLNITMEVDEKALEEVVVVGYGTMRKNDLTGSVVTANLEAFKEAPNTNVLQSVKGTIPGLDIGQTNQAGEEPSIQIRGRNTINGIRSVLIVLDGIIYNGRLGDINPADIESLNVLKDASSKAIYGAQAANGVILITTKSRSRSEKPIITYSSYIASQTPTSDMRLRNREEKLQIIRDIYYKNAYLGPDYTQPNPDWTFAQTELVPENMKGIDEGVDFDWWKALSNPGFLTDHALTINGSTQKTDYYLSGGFTKQKGFLMNDNYKRSSVRINLSTAITDWFTLGANTFGSFTDYSGIYPNMVAMRQTSPLVKPVDEKGEFIIFPTGATNLINPFLAAQADNKDIKNRFNGTFYGIVKIPAVKGLEYRLNFSNDFISENYFNANRYDANRTGAMQKINRKQLDRTIDNIINYDNRFGHHGISATFVTGYRSNEAESTNAEGENIANISLSYNSLQQAAIQRIYSYAWKGTFLYQMGRVNYNYKNTYLITGTLRRDGYSGFSKNNKFALFPSVGLAWIVSNNAFMSGSKIDLLKIRGSFGVNGNMTSRYSSLAKVSTPDESKFVFGEGGTSIGQSLTSLPNNNLRWEKSNGLNIGVDFGLLDNRLGGSVEYYHTATTDLLWNIVIPQITGFSSISSNVGKLQNNGVEVMLSTTPVRTKSFEWNVNLNYASNKNKIVSLLGEDKNKDGREDDLPGSNLFIGKSIGTIYHYQIQGIWQLNDEVMTGYYPGAYRIVDQDNDGTITADKDRVFLGRSEPAYSFGVQSEMKYKGFVFRFFVNSIQGGKNGYLGGNAPANVASTGNFANLNTFNYDLWSVSNPGGKYAVGWSVPQINPTPYYSRSFVRLQDVSLAYQVNSALVNKIGGRHIKVFASGKNLITLTDWDGWDPETGQGINSDAYPVLKSFSLGIELSF